MSAGEVPDEGEEGGTGAHTGRSHWVNQISLELPRASDPVWVAARGLQALGGSCHPPAGNSYRRSLHSRRIEWSSEEVAKGTHT